MKLKFLIDEDMVNYKKTSMFVGFPYCSFKCDIDNGNQYCQNYYLKDEKIIDISVDDLCKRYLDNPLTHAIVLAGLEPFDSSFDLTTFVATLRTKYGCEDDIVIYTGYTKEELCGTRHKDYPEVNFEKLQLVFKELHKYKNIIIKYGRYIPGHQKHMDEVLCVNLASDNQYAEVING